MSYNEQNGENEKVVDGESIDFRKNGTVRAILGKACVTSWASMFALSDLADGKDDPIGKMILKMIGRPESIRDLTVALSSTLHVLIKNEVITFEELWDIISVTSDSNSSLPKSMLNDFKTGKIKRVYKDILQVDDPTDI